MRYKQTGFTLIELIIAITIIGILAAIAIPGYQEYTLLTKRTDAKTALLRMADNQERWYSNNNTYTDAVADVGGATTPKDYYTLSVESASSTGYTLRATAQGDQTSDTGCLTLELTHAGAQTPAGCW